ncbi:ATP-binding protein [Nonomuraea lactucae]|uniref:ATP-binding protein n=1 Tax=Nonomuraea lactucae TaxID=2249762 RepID=UPI000DE2351C|nr:ATP-binding protein [Nonomuraea lactucae]
MINDDPLKSRPVTPRTSERAGPSAPEREPILDQPFDGDSLYALRATLEAHASQAGFPEGRAMDLVITVHELASNAVLHGAGTGHVQIWRLDDALRCQISDAGAPRPDTGTATHDTGTATHNTGTAGRDAGPWSVQHGHGLWIARYLTDHFTIESGPDGTVATVSFALPATERRSPFALSELRRDSHTVLALAGTLDDQAAHEITGMLRDLVSEHAEPRLVLDLAAVTFWDAMGIAALISAQQRVNETRAGVMILTGLSPELRARLDALSPVPFTICDTPDQAAQRLTPPSTP